VHLIVINATRNTPVDRALVRINSTVLPISDRFTDSVGHTDLSVVATNHLDLTGIKAGFRPGRARFMLDTRRTRDTTLYLYLYEGNACYVSGTVKDEKGNVVEGALVTIDDTIHFVHETTLTDRDGKYMFVLEPGSSVKVNVTGQGYFTSSNYAGITNNQGNCEKMVDFTMNYMLADRTLALENIYYDFDKWYIRDEAVIILEKVKRIMIDNPTMMIEVSSHTDMRGTSRYNDELSVRRAEVVMDYLVRNGISPERLTYKVYGKVRPAIPCKNESDCNEAKHQLNRRTEFKVLYF
jgi:outer membrane protein OmpA-like peptidoglycan-associated protein